MPVAWRPSLKPSLRTRVRIGHIGRQRQQPPLPLPQEHSTHSNMGEQVVHQLCLFAGCSFRFVLRAASLFQAGMPLGFFALFPFLSPNSVAAGIAWQGKDWGQGSESGTARSLHPFAFGQRSSIPLLGFLALVVFIAGLEQLLQGSGHGMQHIRLLLHKKSCTGTQP